MHKRIAPLILLLFNVGCEPPPLSPNGVVNVFGRLGMGPGAFSYPRALAMSPDHKLFVVDKTARVQRFDTEGHFETSWPMPEHIAGKPVGISVHPDGRVFVPDTHYSRVIVFDRDGHELARFGKQGRGDGEFELPTDVTFDANGNVYVSEYNGNDRVTRWTPDLQFDRELIAGDINGRPLRRPSAIRVDREQTIWIADACNHRILRFDLDGKLLHSFGQLGTGLGQLKYPYDLDIDDNDHLLVTEFGNCRLQWFDKTGRSLNVWGSAGRDIGQLNSPWGAIVAADGRVFALDSLNARIEVIQP